MTREKNQAKLEIEALADVFGHMNKIFLWMLLMLLAMAAPAWTLLFTNNEPDLSHLRAGNWKPITAYHEWQKFVEENK